MLERTDVEELYLVAHSMGNRPLTRAFRELARSKPDIHARIREVILTAPDIDAQVFTEQLMPAMIASGSKLTLYASANDKALLASKKVHGNPRAGDAGDDLIIAPGMETIDATRVETSFIGHSYFADTKTVLSDILQLIRERKRAAERTESLRAVQTERGTYWEFR